MIASRIALIACAALALSSPVFAQADVTPPATSEPAPAAEPGPATETAPATTAQLNDLDAERINPNQITIDFEYSGGACEEVGPAEVGEIANGTLPVTFPTISTAEVCTQQLVEIDVQQTIEAEHIVSLIDVTLTAPDGTVIATGQTDVDQD